MPTLPAYRGVPLAPPTALEELGALVLGNDALHLDQQRVEQHHVRRLQALGYTVTLFSASA
jgi:hypothetical protein